MKCQQCGAECAAGTSFCRQCGAAIDSGESQVAAEQTTLHLDQAVTTATQPFEPRTTGPDPGGLPVPAPVPPLNAPAVTAPEGPVASRRGILIGAVMIVVLGVVCAAALFVLRGQSRATTDLFYPGARIVFDMTNEGGERALHLETSDSLIAVEEWYRKSLKPEKTVQLTSTSVVLKNKKTTATIATEGGKTNILLKVWP